MHAGEFCFDAVYPCAGDSAQSSVRPRRQEGHPVWEFSLIADETVMFRFVESCRAQTPCRAELGTTITVIGVLFGDYCCMLRPA